MKGYKVFSPDFTCRGFRYEVGKTYEMEASPRACGSGFHFCKRAVDCFSYYKFDPENKVAEVFAAGEIVEEGDKCATNKIQIVREIPWPELLNLVNTGHSNTGHSNTGRSNSGHYNSGHYNSGHHNTGDHNSGNYNVGNCNAGDSNVGSHNIGNSNVGHSNAGRSNTGHKNIGNWNTGNSNGGDGNIGHFNVGKWNVGDSNTGNRNVGDCNPGSFNTGDCNWGNFCTGDFNSGDYNTGFFCTEERRVRLFDQETDMSFREWRESKAYSILCRVLYQPFITWVDVRDMTDDEKAAHPNCNLTKGYLKKGNITEAFASWWASLSDKEREIIKSIPNFNAEKFKKITGIDVG